MDNYKDVVGEFKKLELENYLEIEVPNNYMKIPLILEKARCKFIGNMYMEIADAISIYFKNEYIEPRVIIPLDMFEYYYELLKSAETKNMITVIKLLMKHQFKEGDTIKFLNGKRGMILKPTKEHYQIHYKLIKKDGSLGVKEMVLYAQNRPKYGYDCENREFVNYEII